MRERSRWRYWVLQYHVHERYRVSGHAPRVPHSIVMAAVWPIVPWRRGDGEGTVKKESNKEVERVANNYPR
jgi:hypothetical protein